MYATCKESYESYEPVLNVINLSTLEIRREN